MQAKNIYSVINTPEFSVCRVRIKLDLRTLNAFRILDLVDILDVACGSKSGGKRLCYALVCVRKIEGARDRASLMRLRRGG